MMEGVFMESMRMLGAAFGQQIHEAVLEAYWYALSDIDAESLSVGFSRAIRESERMPPPSEIRRLAGGGDKIEAEKAWSAVRGAVGSVGRYRSVDFDDKRINAAIREIGGWQRLCSRGGDDFHIWARREFVGAYSNLGGRGQLGEGRTRHLAGIHETDPDGVKDPPVRLLSDGRAKI